MLQDLKITIKELVNKYQIIQLYYEEKISFKNATKFDYIELEKYISSIDILVDFLEKHKNIVVEDKKQYQYLMSNINNKDGNNLLEKTLSSISYTKQENIPDYLLLRNCYLIFKENQKNQEVINWFEQYQKSYIGQIKLEALFDLYKSISNS